MTSLTIDQLKKSLTEQGIALPPSGSKKADYVRLYEQYSTLNENLGDFYSSDDENPPRNSSQSVTSSSSPSKIESIVKEVERLTDDELYTQLKELGASIGPVLKNTRRVYEKKLIKLLGGGGGGGSNSGGSIGNQTNGLETSNAFKSDYSYRVEEFSDSEIDMPPVKSSYNKVEYRDGFSKRKSSVNRESPKPSIEETVSEPVLEKRYSVHTFSEPENKKPLLGSFSTESKSSRFSFIETIPKGSTYRYIEPTTGVDYPSSTIRSRYNTEKINYAQDGLYRGTWEPNMKKYLAPQQQSKMSKKIYSSASSSSAFTSKASSFKQNIIAILIVLAFILLILYLYFYQWSAADPYKEIEEDVKREMEHLTANNADFK